MKTFVPIVTVAIALAGCGGGTKTVTVTNPSASAGTSGGSAAATTPKKRAAGHGPEEFLHHYYDVMATEPTRICDLMTNAAKAQAIKDAGSDTPYKSCEAIYRDYGGMLAGVTVKSVDNVTIDGDRAAALVRFAGAGYADQDVEVVRNDDGWLLDSAVDVEK